jgi:hypothetical protein
LAAAQRHTKSHEQTKEANRGGAGQGTVSLTSWQHKLFSHAYHTTLPCLDKNMPKRQSSFAGKSIMANLLSVRKYVEAEIYSDEIGRFPIALKYL